MVVTQELDNNGEVKGNGILLYHEVNVHYDLLVPRASVLLTQVAFKCLNQLFTMFNYKGPVSLRLEKMGFSSNRVINEEPLENALYPEDENWCLLLEVEDGQEFKRELENHGSSPNLPVLQYLIWILLAPSMFKRKAVDQSEQQVVKKPRGRPPKKTTSSQCNICNFDFNDPIKKKKKKMDCPKCGATIHEDCYKKDRF